MSDLPASLEVVLALGPGKAIRLFDADGFARQVRVRIAERHISVREAAAEIGCSHGTVSRVCNCKPPDVENYLRIVRWLEKSEE